MADLIIVEPSHELKEAIKEYRREYFDYGESHINGSSGLIRYDDFEEWLEMVASNANASTFFSVRKADNRIIGSIQLRHSLTPELEKHGGHIGYGIRPSERRKGYGRQQLRLVLDAAKEMGIPKVLITCDKDNTASGRTAASCGGILSHEAIFEGKLQQYFWISLGGK